MDDEKEVEKQASVFNLEKSFYFIKFGIGK